MDNRRVCIDSVAQMAAEHHAVLCLVPDPGRIKIKSTTNSKDNLHSGSVLVYIHYEELFLHSDSVSVQLVS